MFGIINDDDFTKQLLELEKGETTSPKVSIAKVIDIERGRPIGKKEIPTEIRKIISEEKLSGTPAKELSQLFGVSSSSISAYGNDATSTASYNQPNAELKEHNDVVRERISTGARSRLMAALDQITDEKLEGAKVRDVASVAKDMSAIIKNMEPEHSGGGSRLNQQFIFMTPKTRSEDDFEFIEARE